jgi:excisionase family DNA binding protein
MSKFKEDRLPEVMTITQAARIAGKTKQAISDAVKRGRIPSLRIGHVALINRTALLSYLKTVRGGGRKPAKRKPV